MARALPPLTWFRSFEASARTLSFTAAAQEIGLTQSAISQQVRLLEERLGAQLFQRKARGLALTDDGRRLLPKVGASLTQLAEATAAFDIGTQADTLTIAASVSVVRWLIAPHLRSFLDLHPALRVRIVGAIWPDDFNAPLADIEIRYGSAAQVGRDATRLGPDGLIAVAATSQKLRGARLIETVGASEGWQDWAAEAGMNDQMGPPHLFVDSYGAALEFAENGTGVALTNSILAKASLRAGRLVTLGDTSLVPTEGYFLASRTQSDASHAFCHWMQSLI